MKKKDFWALIDDARKASGGDVKVQAEWLTITLTGLTAEAIIRFDRHFHTQRSRIYDPFIEPTLIEALECSDDGYADFSGWLVAQGRDFMTRVLHEPQAFAPMLAWKQAHGIGASAEEMLYVAQEAYSRKTGYDLP